MIFSGARGRAPRVGAPPTRREVRSTHVKLVAVSILMSPKLISVPWERPFLPQLVERLTADCAVAPWDLRELMVVVPTQESGRRLRQALARAAADAGTGVLSPSILTPEQLVRAGLGPEVASDLDALAAWVEVLLAVDLEEFRAVVPSDPARRDARWAVGFAQQLVVLQRELGEHGLDFAAVEHKVQATPAEPERWRQLAQLERQWVQALQRGGRANPAAALLDRASRVRPPTGIKRVVVAGVADPSPLSVRLLGRWQSEVPVEVLVHGPVEPGLFDGWGRPRPDLFSERQLPVQERVRLQVTRDVKEAADFASRVAAGYRDEPQTLALGLVNPEASAALQLAFARQRLEVHDPAGRSLAAGGLGLLARQLLRLATDLRVTVVAQVLRNPWFAHYAVQMRGWVEVAAELLGAFDQLLSEHLPVDLHAALPFAQRNPRLAGLAAALEWLRGLQERLRQPQAAAALAEALAAIIAGAKGRLGAADDDVDALREILSQAAATEARFRSFSSEAVLATLEGVLTHTRVFPLAPAGAWDLQGWLELGYDPAPHLVLIGCNEGCVPETIHGDPFLPNTLRERLGMRSNRERLARDHYLLEALMHSRLERGRVDVLVPQLGLDGEPLQPSRLLFRCADRELVTRARQLFADLPPPPPSPARRPAWQLQPLPIPRLPERFSPSAIKTYLSCPFRYYLTHILRMQPVEVGQREITPQVFGDLCHGALQRMGECEALRDELDPAVLAEFLVEDFTRRAHERFGVVESFALRVQLESVKARLRAAAEVEAEQRQLGWRILKCEDTWTMNVRGIMFTGRIDRIDHHPESGMYRLIDYKTFDREKTPEATHWCRSRPGEQHVLPASIFDRVGEPWRWTDLQLPLYLLAARPIYGDRLAAGYFLLPKTKEETRLRLWEDLAPEQVLHAEACAVAVAEAVASGRFWPAAAKLAYPHDTDYLFPDGIDLNVAGGKLTQWLEREGRPV
jgi:ATP-dependent helicase/nuclease subunit B